MTHDEIIALPQYLNASYEGDDLYTGKQLIEYAKLVAAKEREACAKIVEPSEDHRENFNDYLGGEESIALLDNLASLIRAKGE